MEDKTGLYSSLRSCMNMIVQALEESGISSNEIESKIPEASKGNILGNCGRVSANKFQEFLSHLSDNRLSPILSFTLGKYYHPMTFKALGPSCYFSETLRENLDIFSKYYKVITTANKITIEDTGHSYILKMAASEGIENNLYHQGWISVVLAHIRLSLDKNIVPEMVNIQMDNISPKLKNEIKELLNAPVEFNANETSIEIKNEYLDLLQPNADHNLQSLNLKMVEEYIVLMKDSELPMKVQMQILELLETGKCEKAKVAKQVGLSVRTLSDKLQQFDLSYQDLLDLVRISLANEYMSSEKLSLVEISDRLCFAGYSNFSRAYKNLTGITPKEYQKSCQTNI